MENIRKTINLIYNQEAKKLVITISEVEEESAITNAITSLVSAITGETATIGKMEGLIPKTETPVMDQSMEIPVEEVAASDVAPSAPIVEEPPVVSAAPVEEAPVPIAIPTEEPTTAEEPATVETPAPTETAPTPTITPETSAPEKIEVCFAIKNGSLEVGKAVRQKKAVLDRARKCLIVTDPAQIAAFDAAGFERI